MWRTTTTPSRRVWITSNHFPISSNSRPLFLMTSSILTPSISSLSNTSSIFAFSPNNNGCHFNISSSRLYCSQTHHHDHEDLQKFKSIFVETEKKAQQNDSFAQFSLGVMYYRGEGVARNMNEAIKW